MILSVAFVLAALSSRAAALGSSCASTAIGAGLAGPTDPFWLETIKHQGTAAFNSNSSYVVFRNVKDYGAKGDGKTDDTSAINKAIADGSRKLGSIYPAVVYFPQGTYVVSDAINALYYTQLVGDARVPPTLKAAAKFKAGAAVIDADPSNSYTPNDNFFRSVRNFNIDLTATSKSSTHTGIHWRVSKGTSLTNIAFQLGAKSNNQGIFTEDGSGGFIGDLVINGGKYGLNVGSQQFTTRNVTVNGASTGVHLTWAYGWTFQDVSFNNVDIGFDINGDGILPGIKGVGSVAVIDSVATNSKTFLRSTGYVKHTEDGGSIVLDNIQLNSVTSAVVDGGLLDLLPKTILAADKTGSTTIVHWEQGTAYVGGQNNTQVYNRGEVAGPVKPAKLLNSAGNIVGRSRPQYADYAASQFVSVKDLGAKGDGKTDDTAALQAAINQYSGCKIIFVDAGTYLVTKTLGIPIGTQIVGEAWSVIAGTGAAFQDVNNPAVVVQVGTGIFQPGGTLEISDIIFTTQGNAPGAIVVEWNAHDGTTAQATVGAWDTHIRLGSTAGSGITSQNCGTRQIPDITDCDAAFLGLHLTLGSSAYLEGLWVWLGDYDLNSHAPVYALSGRGILSESQGPVWLIGTAAENHAVYQYNLYAVNNHYLGFAQGSTPSYETASGNGHRKRLESLRFKRDSLSARTLPIQPNPNKYHDPIFDPSGPVFAWGLYISSTRNTLVFGGGFYSPSTQDNIVFIDTGIAGVPTTSNSTSIYALNTVGATDILTTSYKITAKANQAGASGQATIASWTVA